MMFLFSVENFSILPDVIKSEDLNWSFITQIFLILQKDIGNIILQNKKY